MNDTRRITPPIITSGVYTSQLSSIRKFSKLLHDKVSGYNDELLTINNRENYQHKTYNDPLSYENWGILSNYYITNGNLKNIKKTFWQMITLCKYMQNKYIFNEYYNAEFLYMLITYCNKILKKDAGVCDLYALNIVFMGRDVYKKAKLSTQSSIEYRVEFDSLSIFYL